MLWSRTTVIPLAGFTLALLPPDKILCAVFTWRTLNSSDKHLPYIQYWEEESHLPPAILWGSPTEQLTQHQALSTLPLIARSTAGSIYYTASVLLDWGDSSGEARWLQWTCWPSPTCWTLCNYHAIKLPSHVCWIWGADWLDTSWDFSHQPCSLFCAPSTWNHSTWPLIRKPLWIIHVL